MKIKNIIKIIPAILLALCVFSFSVCAVEEDEISDKIPDEFSEYLPEGNEAENLPELVKSFDVNFFFSQALKIFLSVSPKAVRAFSTVLGLLIISSVISVVRDSTAREELKSILSYICAVCVCGAAYSVMGGLFDAVTEFVSVAGKFLRYIIPSVAVLSAAGGTITFSAVCSGVLYTAVALLETLCEGVLLPLIRICLCISMGATVLGNDGLSGVINPLKKLITLSLTFSMLTLSVVMSFQGIIAKSTDTALLKGIKFAASSIIPVVGGAVGDALSSLSTGVSIVKTALGTAGSAIIVIILLSPLCMLFAYKLMFEITSAASGLLGMTREGKFLSEMGSLTGYLMAVISCVGVFFIIAIAAFSAVGVS